MGLYDQQADVSERDGTAGREEAAVPNCPQAIGPDGLEEPAEQRQNVEVGGARARPTHLPGGKGDRALLERDHTAVREGDFEDRGAREVKAEWPG